MRPGKSETRARETQGSPGYPPLGICVCMVYLLPLTRGGQRACELSTIFHPPFSHLPPLVSHLPPYRKKFSFRFNFLNFLLSHLPSPSESLPSPFPSLPSYRKKFSFRFNFLNFLLSHLHPLLNLSHFPSLVSHLPPYRTKKQSFRFNFLNFLLSHLSSPSESLPFSNLCLPATTPLSPISHLSCPPPHWSVSGNQDSTDLLVQESGLFSSAYCFVPMRRFCSSAYCLVPMRHIQFYCVPFGCINAAFPLRYVSYNCGTLVPVWYIMSGP